MSLINKFMSNMKFSDETKNKVSQLHTRDKVKEKKFPTFKNFGGVFQADLLEFNNTINTQEDYKKKFVLTFVETSSGKSFAYPLINKKGSEIIKKTRIFLEDAKKKLIVVKFLETDNGSEFINNDFKKLMTDNKIIHSLKMAGKKNQMAKVEKLNYDIRTLANINKTANKTDTVPTANTLKKIMKTITTHRDETYKRPKIKDFFLPPILPKKSDILKVDDKVRVNLFAPTQSNRFRAGAPIFNEKIMKIEAPLFRNGNPAQYKLKGVNNAIFNRRELKKVV